LEKLKNNYIIYYYDVVIYRPHENIPQLKQDIQALEELSRHLFLEAHDLQVLFLSVLTMGSGTFILKSVIQFYHISIITIFKKRDTIYGNKIYL